MQNNQLAFLFPGQGSQRVGMLSAMAEEYPLVAKTFAEASEVLGYNLWELVQQGPQEELNLTERTQPMLLTASVAIWRIWQEIGGATPAYMAGHSLGEFTALVCAQSLGFQDAVKLVQQRGAFMQTAVPVGQGAMAAIIGLSDELIVTSCKDASDIGVVAAVNFNSPGQVVIAGETAAVDKAIELCKAAGAKRALPLPVSAPFHTELMKPAGVKLEEQIKKLTFATPVIPVVHNVHGKPEQDAEKIKALLVEQIYSPVQWVSCVQYMREQGIELMVECGPGKVLSGLNRRIDKALNSCSTEEPAEIKAAHEQAGLANT